MCSLSSAQASPHAQGQGTVRIGPHTLEGGWAMASPSFHISSCDVPVLSSVLSAFPNNSCFSPVPQSPGPLMDPLTKATCGSQMAQTLLWKAKSSLSFGIQPLQMWPTKDPEVESQVNL